MILYTGASIHKHPSSSKEQAAALAPEVAAQIPTETGLPSV